MEIKNDIQLEVAVANSRKAKSWKNKTLSWSGLLDRMSKTTTTPETLAEYRAMSRDRQSEIKDVGAFVGGYLAGGRRTSVTSRSILALDADFATPGLWTDFLAEFDVAAAVYSTHKHTPDNPRLRLVVPLSRPVTPDEYQAIGRRVAATLGIDQFDDTTYQPQRIMYWPSTSQDGEFVFQYHDAPALDADQMLATYRDWTDISAWPMSSRVADIAKRATSQQADPLTKPGLIGAFCRTYTIEEAIETFIPSYVPCNEPGRYTYIDGSTAAGVVTYDGKFSYSFHGTDPTSGQLCNAWDLVRIFLFGAADQDINPDTPATKRPSFLQMSAKVSADPRVRAQIVQDRLAETDGDFTDLDGEQTAEDNWGELIKTNSKGEIAASIDNIVVILEHDPLLAGRLVYDAFHHNIVNTAKLPWRDSLGAWSDTDDSALRHYLEKRYGISSKDKIFDAVNVVADKHTWHPVRAYLDSCTWDGTPRVETVLIDYLGAEDTEYTRAVTRKTIVAAVARIYNPGVKFDYMLVLKGKQGLGKSALCRKLGGQWFSDSFSTFQGKEAYEQTLGAWIIEMGELAGMRKAEAEQIKLFITKQVDRFRPAYGRRTQEYPRQCIFVGTTNESQFLRDSTGNRRFWVVDTPHTPALDLWEGLTDDLVRQIWGEAVCMYMAGEELFLSKDLEQVARDTQAEYEEENPHEGIIREYLDRLLPEDWEEKDLYARRQWLESPAIGTVPRDKVSCVELWAEAFGQPIERLDRYGVKEITDIMAKLDGWERARNLYYTRPPYGRQRYYRRKN